MAISEVFQAFDREAHPAEKAAPVVSLSVVIPIINEEEILDRTVEAVVAALEHSRRIASYEIILSENGSRDNTRLLAHRLATTNPNIKVITSDVADYGAAMRAGFLAASGDFIANFDADYYDFDFLAAALSCDADVVIAAKNIVGANDARASVRRTVSRSFGWLVRRILSITTSETHGMKLFRREAIADLLGEVRATKDLFDTELVARAEWSSLTIRQLPVTTIELRHSRSGILRRIPRTLWGLLCMRVRLRSLRTSPVGYFGTSPNYARREAI